MAPLSRILARTTALNRLRMIGAREKKKRYRQYAIIYFTYYTPVIYYIYVEQVSVDAHRKV